MSSHGHQASELVICKSVGGGLEESRAEVGSWNCVGSLSTHLGLVSNVVQFCRSVRSKRYMQR